MKVYGFKKNESGVMELENSLKAEQRFVGGLIDVVELSDERGLDLVVNDEGLLEQLEPRAIYIGKGLVQIFVGDCFVCRHNSEGEFESIRDEDIPYIEECLKSIKLINGLAFYY